MNITNEQVGNQVKNLREYRKVNLRELARGIKVNHTALNKIENGTQKLDMETLGKLVNYFGVTADYFLSPDQKIEGAVKTQVTTSRYRAGFKRVLDEYLSAKSSSLKNNELGQFVRSELVEIMNTEIPLDAKKYLVTGSVGQGIWATIPWISCFDRSITKSATNGYYLVYLFKEDMSGFYLSLNQGYTYFREKYGAKEGRLKIQHTAKLLRSKIEVPDEFKLPSIDLNSLRDLAIGYEKGHIFGKYYDANNLPTDAELISDFHDLLEAYNKIVVFMNGRSVREFNDYLLLQDDLEFLETDEETYQQTANDIANSMEAQKPSSDEEGPRPPKDPIVDEGGKERYPRKAKEAANALLRSNYMCEVDPTHETFISKSTGNKYGEAHHFIGISHHRKFPEVDLDRAANIVCLCPTCHRKIHHAVDEVRLPMVETLFEKVKDRLGKVGIEVTMTQLKEFYDIKVN